MRLSPFLVLGVVCAAMAPRTSAAQPVIDPTATVVELRVSCAMPGSTFLDNCFETSAEVSDWLWDGGRTSPPNSMDQVVVRVGPGDFDPLRCDGAMNGWVSFEGSGRTQTRFVNDDPAADPSLPGGTGACPGGITVNGCTDLNFNDLAAWGRSIGIHWIGDGDSTWHAVDAIADSEGAQPPCDSSGSFYTFGWFDVVGGQTGKKGVHYFFDSRIRARGSTAFLTPYYSNAAETWMYASDLLAEKLGGGVLLTAGAQIGGQGAGDLRLFGSTVRVMASEDVTGEIYGFLAGSTIHMHGGIVNLTANREGSTNPLSLVSIRAVGSTGFVHTPETAFVFVAIQDDNDTVSRTRISTAFGGRVDSPFLWPPGQDPPPITSTDGSDMFVKTNGGASGTDSVLYLLDNDCPAPHWRSSADGSCL